MSKVFISYSWDSEAHKAWVREFAARLRKDGVDAILDQWYLVPGDQLPAFMEQSVRESDFVLVVCTARYKLRADRRDGGVGYEGDIMTGERFTGVKQRKFIPILRQVPWSSSAPSWLAGKYFIDLSQDPYDENQYTDLITTLQGTRTAAPPLGAERAKPHSPRKMPDRSVSATSAARQEAIAAFEPIRIVGIIADQVGTPRGDGTRGSELYDIPFRLSAQPPQEWIDAFLSSWNHPPHFTLMHRPGIASVVGNVIHLNGTTLDEIQKYHRDTLILAASEANRAYVDLREKQASKAARERDRLDQHRRDIENRTKDIKFD